MAATTIGMFIQRLGFADILLWLLVFAVTYGILSQAGIPKGKGSKEVQVIIAMVLGFLVIFSAPAGLISFVANLSAGFVLILLGVLVLVIFFEVSGLKHVEKGIDPKTGKEKSEVVYLFSKYPTVLGITFIIIAALLFVSAGGLNLIGFKNLPAFDITGTIFFIALILAILWIIKS